METPAWLAEAQQLLQQEAPLEALSALEAGLAELLTCVDGWILHGGILNDHLGRSEEAIASYDQALKLTPKNDAIWSDRGFTLGKLGRYDEAIASCDQALKLNPENDAAWSHRGAALNELGRYDEAIASYDQALKLNSDYDAAWYRRGWVLGSSGRHDEAIASYDQALKLNPDCDAAWHYRGVSLNELGRCDEAIASYDQALKLDPNYHRTWVNRGLALGELGRYEEAITSYDQALKLNSDDYRAWNNRGVVLRKLGRYDEAITSYDQALKLNSDDYRAWSNRGWALNELGRYDEAITSYDQALKRNPNNDEAWLNRASAFCNLGRNQISPSNLLTAIRQQSISIFRQPEPHISALREALPHLTQNSLPWARIHQGLGDVCLKHGNLQQNARPYWRDAVRAYQNALPIFTAKAVLESQLETLQGLIRALLALEDIPAARTYQEQGRSLFEQLRDRQPENLKPAFEIKFSSFSHLEIDLLIGEQNLVAALEQAEFYKNRCLTWILDAWQEKVLTPTYADMRTLCNAHTAILYWHISPNGLTTFLFTEGNLPQILESDRTIQSRRFEKWMQNFDRQYRDYASKKRQPSDRRNHPWRKTLESELDKLRDILQIEQLCEQLPNTIDTLILLPHRDLHRFPLHALFPERFTISYLPSLQIGLNLRDRSSPSTYTPLLNVDDPDTEQPAMPYAQLESAIVRQLVKNTTHIPPTEANCDRTLQALKEPHKTFHFTGHAAYNSRSPENSAIALTDGLLTAKQISQLDLSSYSLICLAACETALTGQDNISTEYVGLATAFLKAGASNVLSTLWQVDEVSSCWFIIRFYQTLLAGHSPVQALHHTQQWLRSQTYPDLVQWIDTLLQLEGLSYRWCKELEAAKTGLIPTAQGKISHLECPYRDPFHWAAFTLTGGA